MRLKGEARVSDADLQKGNVFQHVIDLCTSWFKLGH